MASVLNWFRPTFDAIFSTIPFKYRWRLLCFQPLAILTYSLNSVPWMFSSRYSVRYIPTRSGQRIRTLVFQPPRRKDDMRLRPLHLDIHGGGFIGGHPEADSRFCSAVSDSTGAVVVSSTYRFAPRHLFPAAIDDIDDVVAWLMQNAESELKADPKLFTTGGSSAGGNLAIAASQQAISQRPSLTAIKGSVTFYAPVDLRLEPGEKPVPPNYPTKDPIAWLQPMFNSYAGDAGECAKTDPRANPILSDIKSLPENMLFIIPMIDILIHEQLTFIERLKKDIEAMGDEGRMRTVEGITVEKCFHGWLERWLTFRQRPQNLLTMAVPSFVINEQTRTDVFDVCCKFIAEIHRKHGFDLNDGP